MKLDRGGRVAGLLAAWTISACAAAVETHGDAPEVARGKEVYEEQRCRSCHSIDGVGNKRYPLDGVGGRLSEQDVRKWIVSPREMDPEVRKRAYDKLTGEDLDALVAFLMSLKEGEDDRGS